MDFLKQWFIELTFNQALLVVAIVTIGYIVKYFVGYIADRDSRDIELKKADMREREKTIEALNNLSTNIALNTARNER